jgi:hypothetical protein
VTSTEERALLTDFFLGSADDGVTLATDMAPTPNHRTNNADNSVLAALWKAVDQNADASCLAGEEFLVAMGSPEGRRLSVRGIARPAFAAKAAMRQTGPISVQNVNNVLSNILFGAYLSVGPLRPSLFET